MEQGFELSFCQLRTKEVVNSIDGKKLGKIIDIVFSTERKLLGIVVPHCKRSFIFRSVEQIFIPWKCVKKIGSDIILVQLFLDDKGYYNCLPKKDYGYEKYDLDPPPPPPPKPMNKDYPPKFYKPPPYCDYNCNNCNYYDDCRNKWREDRR